MFRIIAPTAAVFRLFHQRAQLFLRCQHCILKNVNFSVAGTTNKPACLELVKIPGRYQVNIISSMSTIMHGIEAVTPFSGGYRFRREASFTFDVSFPGFEFVFGSLSA